MNKEIVERLKEHAHKLKKELQHVEALLSLYDVNNSNEKKYNSDDNHISFVPELKPQNEKPESLTSKAKKGIRELMNYPLSYQKDDLLYNLKKLGFNDITKSTLHSALTSLRNEGDVVAFRVNRSNQLVYYVSTKGVNKNNSDMPIKENYIPNGLNLNEISEFEFLD